MGGRRGSGKGEYINIKIQEDGRNVNEERQKECLDSNT